MSQNSSSRSNKKLEIDNSMTKSTFAFGQTTSASPSPHFGSTPTDPFITVTKSSTEETAEKTEQKRKVGSFNFPSPTANPTTPPFFYNNSTIKFGSPSSMTANKGSDREDSIASSSSASSSLFTSLSPAPGTTENAKPAFLFDSASATVNALKPPHPSSFEKVKSNKVKTTFRSDKPLFAAYSSDNRSPDTSSSSITSIECQGLSSVINKSQQLEEEQSTKSKKRDPSSAFNLSDDSVFSGAPPSKSFNRSIQKDTTDRILPWEKQTSSSLSSSTSYSPFQKDAKQNNSLNNSANGNDDGVTSYQDVPSFSNTKSDEHKTKKLTTHFVPPPQPLSPSGPASSSPFTMGSLSTLKPKDSQSSLFSSVLEGKSVFNKDGDPVVSGTINKSIIDKTSLSVTGSYLGALDSNTKQSGQLPYTAPSSSTLKSASSTEPNKEGIFSAATSSTGSVFERLGSLPSTATTNPEDTKPSTSIKKVGFAFPIATNVRSDSDKSSTASPLSPFGVGSTSFSNVVKETPNLFPKISNTSFSDDTNSNKEKNTFSFQQNTDNNKATLTGGGGGGGGGFTFGKSMGEPATTATDTSSSKFLFSNISTTGPFSATTTTFLPSFSLGGSAPPATTTKTTTASLSSFSLGAPPNTITSSFSLPNLPSENAFSFTKVLEEMANRLFISSNQIEQTIYPYLCSPQFQAVRTNFRIDNITGTTKFTELPMVAQNELNDLERHVHNQQQKCDYIKQRMAQKQVESMEQSRIKTELLTKETDVFYYTLKSQLYDIQMMIDSTRDNLRHVAGGTQTIEQYKNPSDRSNCWLFGYASSDDYFIKLSELLSNRLEEYKRCIWEIERITETWTQNKTKSPQEIANIMCAQNQAFLSLANKIAKLNEMVRNIVQQ